MEMNDPIRALNEQLRDLVHRLSAVAPNDVIAGLLMSQALLVNLRSASIEDAIRRMRFWIEAMELSLVPKQATA